MREDDPADDVVEQDDVISFYLVSRIKILEQVPAIVKLAEGGEKVRVVSWVWIPGYPSNTAPSIFLSRGL